MKSRLELNVRTLALYSVRESLRSIMVGTREASKIYNLWKRQVQ